MYCAACSCFKRRSKKLRNSQVACDDTEHSQHNQRQSHGDRRFLYVGGMMRIDMRGTPKRDEDQAEAVKRRQQRRHEAEYGEDLTEGSGRPGRDEQIILAEEPGCQGESCKCERTH